MWLRDRTALITGAASGIGRAIAVSLAKRGVHLALSDRNETGLKETAALVETAGVRVSTHLLDVSDKDAIAAFPLVVLAAHPGIDILVNNAGVALGGTFEEVSLEDFEWLFSINFWGVVRMTKAFLPVLRRSDKAQIVNISSLFGLISPPGQAAYSASKFAVRGFSNSLRHELSKRNIGVTVAHPGGVATRIALDARLSTPVTPGERKKQEARFSRLLTLPPAEAAEIIVKAVEARKPRVIVGTDARVGALVERLMPVGYWKFLGGQMK